METDKASDYEGTRISLERYDSLERVRPRGIYFQRDNFRSHNREIAIVRESPGEVLEALFPFYRIFGYKQFDFRDLDFNSRRYTGLVLKSFPHSGLSASIKKLHLPKSVKSVARRVSGREVTKLSKEAIKIVDYVANYSVGAFANNSQKYGALAEILEAFKPYLGGEESKGCLEDSLKFITRWNSCWNSLKERCSEI